MTTTTEAYLTQQASILIEQRTGLAAGSQFRGELQSILYNLAQGDLETFINKLQNSHETDPAWQMLINALTIGETYFFRDPAHFRLLRSHILPGLILKRRQQGQLGLNIWSVGCATGEEPYSIAITMQEFLNDLADWKLRLVGTDINAHALEGARRGVYRKWAFRQPPANEPAFQQRYFDGGEFGVHIKPFIRDMVSFRHMNLLNALPLPQLDVIFCRNVLIYFKGAQVEAAENALFDALSPGGWLLLGQSEAIRYRRERWVTHLFPGAAVYQKPLETAALPAGQFAYQQHAQPALEITATDEVPIVRSATYDDALRALYSEHQEDAERLLHEILTYQPDHAPAHMLLATVLANRRALPEARAHVDTALRINPLQADAHYLRALFFLEEGSAEEAKKSLNAAIYCQHNHPLASFMLGNLYAQTGDITRASRSWENTRRAIQHLKADSPITDFSDMTAGNLTALVNEQLEGWKS